MSKTFWKLVRTLVFFLNFSLLLIWTTGSWDRSPVRECQICIKIEFKDEYPWKLFLLGHWYWKYKFFHSNPLFSGVFIFKFNFDANLALPSHPCTGNLNQKMKVDKNTILGFFSPAHFDIDRPPVYLVTMVTMGPVCLMKFTRKWKLVRTLGFFLDFFFWLILTTVSWDRPPVYLVTMVTMGPLCLMKLTRK